MACRDVDQQTGHLWDVLTGEPSLELETRRLTLVAGERGLAYHAD